MQRSQVDTMPDAMMGLRESKFDEPADASRIPACFAMQLAKCGAYSGGAHHPLKGLMPAALVVALQEAVPKHHAHCLACSGGRAEMSEISLLRWLAKVVHARHMVLGCMQGPYDHYAAYSNNIMR